MTWPPHCKHPTAAITASTGCSIRSPLMSCPYAPCVGTRWVASSPPLSPPLQAILFACFLGLVAPPLCRLHRPFFYICVFFSASVGADAHDFSCRCLARLSMNSRTPHAWHMRTHTCTACWGVGSASYERIRSGRYTDYTALGKSCHRVKGDAHSVARCIGMPFDPFTKGGVHALASVPHPQDSMA